MTSEMRKEALEVRSHIKGMPQEGLTPSFLLGILYALLYIGDVLKDGFKKLEKKL